MNFSVLLTEDIDPKTSIRRSDNYVAMSLRDKDCFSKSVSVHSVTHIFVKNNDDKKYSTALYIDNNFKSQVPHGAREKLEESILALL